MTVKKPIAVLVTIIMIIGLSVPINAQTNTQADTAHITMPSIDIPCKNAILISSDTGQVMYEKAADDKVPIASITKVMTLLLAFEAIENGKIALTDKVPVSVHAYEMGGSQIWLEPGEEFTLDEMIKAICVSSANDAAVAVAEFVGGSEPIFAEMMNKRAAELGMTNTVFKNACGLDEEGHLSSARDVSIMSKELLTHEMVFNYSTIWMDTLRGGATSLVNTNKLLKSYTGINGLKTGTTSKAGVCISATANREGMGLIAVVLGAPSAKERFTAATTMLDYGFSTYEIAQFPEVEGSVQTLPVILGEEKEISLTFQTPEKVLIKKGDGKSITAKVSLPEKVQAPIEQNKEVGTVTLYLNGDELAKYPVIVQNAVEKMSFKSGMLMLIKALQKL